MDKLTIIDTSIKDLYVVKTDPFIDQRGSFVRWFCEDELTEILGNRRIKNVNFSLSMKKGSIRGMHFQYSPHAEMKLVRCIKGKVFDVAVDLRMNSPTYLCWEGIELSDENMKLFIIPEGFAHGFQTLENNVEMLYLHTEDYNKNCEGAIRYNDPAINIQWPCSVTEISEKDAMHPLINSMFKGLMI